MDTSCQPISSFPMSLQSATSTRYINPDLTYDSQLFTQTSFPSTSGYHPPSHQLTSSSSSSAFISLPHTRYMQQQPESKSSDYTNPPPNPSLGYGQVPKKFSYDLNKRHPSVTCYENLVKTHGESTGNPIKYTRTKDGWVLHKMTEERWTIKYWDSWYFNHFRGKPWDKITVLYYLANIHIEANTFHTELRREFPDTIDKWGFKGSTCLNRYTYAQYPDMPLPPAGYLLYLSPPVPGMILTPAHLDGYGTQMSTHMVLFGEGCFNKVYSWTPQQIGTRMQEFRKITGIAPENEPQHGPHAKDVTFTINTETQDFDPNKIKQLQSIGIFGDIMTLSPGEVVVLPAGTFHAFLKCTTSSTNSTSLSPMLGYAGDSTYMGSGDSVEEIRYNISNILSIQEQLRLLEQPVIALVELGIFVLFNTDPEYYKNDSYTQIVKTALKPFYESIVLREQRCEKKWSNNYKIQIPVLNPVTDVHLIDSKDLVCSICKMGIVNLYAYVKPDDDETIPSIFYCCRCYEDKNIRCQCDEKVAFKFRLTANPRMDFQVTSSKSMPIHLFYVCLFVHVIYIDCLL